jgi:type II secretory pathway predicted ATPase ExeA
MSGFGDPHIEPEFFMSNLAEDMVTNMQITHERERGAAFVGAFGTGKTRGVRYFAEINAGEVVVVNIDSAKNVRVTELYYKVANAVREHLGEKPLTSIPGKATGKRAVEEALQRWWLALSLEQPRRDDARDPVRRTLIIDEAQGLHPDALSELRFLLDANSKRGRAALGLVIVGNSEFSLKVHQGDSPLSMAIADRLLFMIEYTYHHVTDSDVRQFIDAYRRFKTVEPEAIDLVIANLDTLLPKVSMKSQRSYRNIDKILDAILVGADGGPLNAPAFRRAFPDLRHTPNLWSAAA